MKVHDNSRFTSIVIVLRSAPGFIQTEIFVEVASGGVGFANFQPQIAGMPGSQFGKQSPANTVPPEICMDRQAQQLRLALHHSPHYGESDNALSASRHDEIVDQILADVPLGCFGGYRLHSSDAGQIARARPPHDYWRQWLRVQTGPRRRQPTPGPRGS